MTNTDKRCPECGQFKVLKAKPGDVCWRNHTPGSVSKVTAFTPTTDQDLILDSVQVDKQQTGE